MRRFRKSMVALTAAASLLPSLIVPAAIAGIRHPSSHSRRHHHYKLPNVTAQPDAGPDVKPYFNDPRKAPELPRSAISPTPRR